VETCNQTLGPRFPVAYLGVSGVGLYTEIDFAKIFRMRRWLAVVLVAALVGIAYRLGYQAGSSAQSLSPAKITATSGRETGGLPLVAVAEPRPNQKLPNTEMPASVPTDNHEAEARASRKLLLELQRQKRASIRLPVVTGNGVLSPGFIHLFNLTPSEADKLQQRLDDTGRAIDQLAAANASVDGTKDSVIVTVKPFYEGIEMYDKLLASFAEVLGDERNAAFLALHNNEIGRAFNGFGAEQRTITITRDAKDESSYWLKDNRKSESGTTMTVAEFSDTSKFPVRYNWLLPVIPPLEKLPARGRPDSDVAPGR
jgi:hypothetical protein